MAKKTNIILVAILQFTCELYFHISDIVGSNCSSTHPVTYALGAFCCSDLANAQVPGEILNYSDSVIESCPEDKRETCASVPRGICQEFIVPSKARMRLTI
jgi:hypothetical protein